MKKSISSKEYKNFLSLLIEAREKAGLTQSQLGKRLRQTQSFISKIERGERRIDVIELIYICDALKVSPAAFLRSLENSLSGRK